MSMVLLEGDRVDFAAIQQQLARARISGNKASDIRLEKDGILTFNLGDDLVAIAHMPAPYPWTDLEGPVSTAWMWPKDAQAINVKRHRTFLLISMTGGRSAPISRRLGLTAITALCAQLPGVL